MRKCRHLATSPREGPPTIGDPLVIPAHLSAIKDTAIAQNLKFRIIDPLSAYPDAQLKSDREGSIT
jgi:hypothetical protein